MKKLVAVLALALSLIVPVQCFAAESKLSLGVTTDLLDHARNPVLGQIGIEKSVVRLNAALGAEGAAQGNVDLLARSKGGVYAGIGLFVERLGAEQSSSASSDTTVVTKPHDHGKHKGDKHVRGNKTITNISSMSSMTLGSEKIGLSPSLVLGGAARTGLFFESRVVLSGEYGARGQAALGLRF